MDEALVDDAERETRRMLDFLGLELDARCLSFFDTERPVRTASAAQVRKEQRESGGGELSKTLLKQLST